MDPREKLTALARGRGSSLAALSRMIGRNSSYLQQYITKGSPRKLEEEDRRKYIALAERSVRPGGHLIVGTFGVTGPEKCSSLPVERYDRSKLAARFGDGFDMVKSFEETHKTPWGKPQAFFFGVMRRAADGPETINSQAQGEPS